MCLQYNDKKKAPVIGRENRMPRRRKQDILVSVRAILAIIAMILAFLVLLTGLVLLERVVLV